MHRRCAVPILDRWGAALPQTDPPSAASFAGDIDSESLADTHGDWNFAPPGGSHYGKPAATIECAPPNRVGDRTFNVPIRGNLLLYQQSTRPAGNSGAALDVYHAAGFATNDGFFCGNVGAADFAEGEPNPISGMVVAIAPTDPCCCEQERRNILPTNHLLCYCAIDLRSCRGTLDAMEFSRRYESKKGFCYWCSAVVTLYTPLLIQRRHTSRPDCDPCTLPCVANWNNVRREVFGRTNVCFGTVRSKCTGIANILRDREGLLAFAIQKLEYLRRNTVVIRGLGETEGGGWLLPTARRRRLKLTGTVAVCATGTMLVVGPACLEQDLENPTLCPATTRAQPRQSSTPLQSSRELTYSSSTPVSTLQCEIPRTNDGCAILGQRDNIARHIKENTGQGHFVVVLEISRSVYRTIYRYRLDWG
jgi:hypothetical protein